MFVRRLPYYIAALAALAVIAGVTVARADVSVSTSCQSSRYYGTNCRTVLKNTTPDVMTAEEIAEREANIAKWEKFCEPVGKADAYGVVRLSYAKAGCEFGRNQ